MITIREIKPYEYSFLEDMLYEAIFIPSGEKRLPREVIYQPELYRYIAGFGREGDFCLVAQVHNKLVGAAWVRLFRKEAPGYGFVDEETPELSIAMLPLYRGKGIGSELLEGILNYLYGVKYEKVSLSVDDSNRALGLYKKLGFEVVEWKEGSNIMVKYLQ